ncbi:MAG: hypothetical protein WHT08_17535 [Bryobacteraceae bacterium]
MRTAECRFEDAVHAALAQPERALPDALRQHLRECPPCAQVAAWAAALREERARLEGFAPVPDAGAVWRRMQRRAWSDAAAAAGRPITFVQGLAFAGAAGVAGACFGATSEWFQSLCARGAAWMSAASVSGAASAAAPAWAWLAAAALVAAASFLPVLVWLILAAEKR